MQKGKKPMGVMGGNRDQQQMLALQRQMQAMGSAGGGGMPDISALSKMMGSGAGPGGGLPNLGGMDMNKYGPLLLPFSS